jgi:hypothetical protein
VGSTSEGYALRHGEAAPLPVSWPEGRASASSPGRGWTAMAAKPQDDGYRLYWANTISGQVARWQLDRSGSYQSGTFLSSSQLISEEVGLNADLNGDRIIGRAARVIENNGRVSLRTPTAPLSWDLPLTLVWGTPARNGRCWPPKQTSNSSIASRL